MFVGGGCDKRGVEFFDDFMKPMVREADADASCVGMDVLSDGFVVFQFED